MNIFQWVLGLHVFSTMLILLFLVLSAIFLYQARYANEAVKVISSLKRVSKFLMITNIFLLLLLLSGLGMVISHEIWNEGWVQVGGFMVLFIGAVNGALVASPIRKVLKAVPGQFNEKEGLPADLRQRVNAPWLWYRLISLMGVVLGAIFIMVTQISLEDSLLAFGVSLVGGGIMGWATRGEK